MSDKIKKNVSREELVDKEVSKMNDIIESTLVEEVIKDNKSEFELDGVKYKIEKPNHKIKSEAYRMKTEKFLSLLGEKNKDGTFKYLLEDDLKKAYKERGIDIDKMGIKMTELEGKKNQFKFKIGKSLADKKNVSDIEIFKKEIEDINLEERKLSIKKAKLMEYAIEQQVLIFVYSYLIYLSAYKLNEKKKWVRVWNSFDEFENDQERIINNISFNATFILKDELDIEF